MQPITLVTGNAGKLKEFQALMQGIPIRSAKIDLTEIQGDPIEISRDKCRRAAELIGGPCMIDDTCLIFNAFGTLPGPYIKWYLESMPLDQIVKMLDSFYDKSAEALCVISYSPGPGQDIITVVGKHHGWIVPPRGEGFGWDPIFVPQDGDGRSYGEMPFDMKQRNSHRSRAVDLLKQKI